MSADHMESGENSNLLPLNQKEDESDKIRLWPYMVLVSSFLSFALAGGFNFGIVGSITEAQIHRFNVTLDTSSWTGSVHTATFFMISKYKCYTDPVAFINDRRIYDLSV